MHPYACPSCRNKSRFHIIDQQPISVKLDPQTGDLLEQIAPNDPMSQPFKGDYRRVQCAICSTTGDATLFEKTAQRL